MTIKDNIEFKIEDIGVPVRKEYPKSIRLKDTTYKTISNLYNQFRLSNEKVSEVKPNVQVAEKKNTVSEDKTNFRKEKLARIQTMVNVLPVKEYV